MNWHVHFVMIFWQTSRFFFVYEKQPFIGEVHELTVEFGDDILTIFPKISETLPLENVLSETIFDDNLEVDVPEIF